MTITELPRLSDDEIDRVHAQGACLPDMVGLREQMPEIRRFANAITDALHAKLRSVVVPPEMPIVGYLTAFGNLTGACIDKRDAPLVRKSDAEFAIAALSAHLASVIAERDAAVERWQPIETAPKDGGEVLLLVQHRLRQDRALRLAGRWFNGNWITFNADDAIQRVEPTHWMPLPAPPAERQDQHGAEG